MILKLKIKHSATKLIFLDDSSQLVIDLKLLIVTQQVSPFCYIGICIAKDLFPKLYLEVANVFLGT